MSTTKNLVLPDSLREQFKRPLGQLVAGSISECNQVIATAIREEAPLKVLLVGDTISRHAIKANIRADLIIVDNREMRQPSPPVLLGARKIFSLTNSPGTIALESWDVITQALNAGSTAVVVDGEEDLLVLVAASIAPIGSFVIYGQPGQGVVLVRVTAEKKHELAKVLAKLNEATSV